MGNPRRKVAMLRVIIIQGSRSSRPTGLLTETKVWTPDMTMNRRIRLKFSETPLRT
jgi:hypothetical protein